MELFLRLKFILLVSTVSFLAVSTLLHFGFPPTHDGEYHIIRAWQFDKVFRDGNLYPRWQPDVNNGYGSPLMNYYYPLPYYVISFFHLFGVGFIDSFKLGIIFATLIGALFFFFWARIFWGTIGGLVSSIFYTFSPYHIAEIYVRGSAGEIWSLALFPGLLWSITKVIKETDRRHIIPASLLLALVIFSHNILAYMLISFAVIYSVALLLHLKKKMRLVKLLLFIFISGVGLASIFWIPALFEQQYVRGLLIYNVEEHFPQLYQLLVPSWGTGFSGTDLSQQMSFQIGVANLFAVIISTFVMILLIRKKKKEQIHIGVFFIGVFFVILFLMLRSSLVIWEFVPLLNYFQFPWRFLSLEILIASFLAGSIFVLWNSRVLAIILAAFVILLSMHYAIPAYYWEREDSYYFARSNFVDGTNTPGNIFNTIWMDTTLKKKSQKLEIIRGTGKIETQFVKATHYKFSIITQERVEVQVNTAYFPGWTVFVDGMKTPIMRTSQGLFVFSLERGNHSVDIEFLDTPVRMVGKIISVFSLVFILLYSVIIKTKTLFLRDLLKFVDK